MTPILSPPYSPDLALCNFFLFVSLDEKSPQRETFFGSGMMKQKMAEALKGIKIYRFKNYFEQWKKVLIGVLNQIEYFEPWLVCLSGLSTGLQVKKTLARFPIRAHAWVAGQAPGWGAHERQPIDVSLTHQCFFPSLSPSLLSLKINNHNRY